MYYRENVHCLSVWEFENLWLCHALSQQAWPVFRVVGLFTPREKRVQQAAWDFC